jgi:hypothetical protein
LLIQLTQKASQQKYHHNLYKTYILTGRHNYKSDDKNAITLNNQVMEDLMDRLNIPKGNILQNFFKINTSTDQQEWKKSIFDMLKRKIKKIIDISPENARIIFIDDSLKLSPEEKQYCLETKKENQIIDLVQYNYDKKGSHKILTI